MDKVISGQETLESMSEAKGYNKWILKKFSKYLSGDILEVGCGIGNFSKQLVGFGKLTAFDIEKKYIGVLKKEDTLGISYGIGDLEKGKYFFNQKRFDCIVCLNVLEHIENDNQAILNLNKLLKPKGYLILLVPAHMALYGQIDKAIGHFRRYDKKKLEEQLRKAKFKIIKNQRLNFVGALGWFVAGKILRNKKVEKSKMKIFNFLSPMFLAVERVIKPPLGISVLVIARRSH